MPVPDIDSVDVTPLLDTVNAYLKAIPNQEDGSVSPNTLDKLKTLHWRIDAEVLPFVWTTTAFRTTTA